MTSNYHRTATAYGVRRWLNKLPICLFCRRKRLVRLEWRTMGVCQKCEGILRSQGFTMAAEQLPNRGEKCVVHAFHGEYTKLLPAILQDNHEWYIGGAARISGATVIAWKYREET